MDSLSHYLLEQAKSFEEVNYLKFALNLIVTAVLSTTLSWFYARFGNAIGNRQRFSRNFMPLALTTMLIIFIVKSSVALSLGLVGALSIVRFRSAIKDPEELVYLFLAIGIGLAAGADEIMIATIAFVLILGLLLLQTLLRGGRAFRTANNMHLNISTSSKDLTTITDILGKHFPFIELKRIDESGQRLDAAFLVSAANVQQIEDARKALGALSEDTTISFVEQRNLPV